MSTKKKKITRLSAAPGHELAEEVSIVPSGAQSQTFLLTKEGKMNIEEILKTVLETEAENEEALDALLEKAKDITEKQKGALKAAFRLLSGASDAVPKDLLKRIAALAGAEDDEDDDDDKPAFLQDKKKDKKKAKKEGDDPKPEPKPDAKKGDDVKKEQHIVKAGDIEIDIGGLDDAAKPVVEILVKALDAKDKTVDALQKQTDALVDKIATEEFVQKANDEYGHLPGDKTELGTMLKNLHAQNPDLAKTVEKQLASSNAMLKKSSLLTEFGGRGHESAPDAWGKMEALAKEKVSKDTTGKLTFEKAIEVVMEEDPGLYAEYRDEKGSH